MTPLGWGLVGCGWVARDYVAPAIRADRQSRLVACFDPNPDAARAVAVAGDARVCDSLRELLADRGVTAVYVATPNHTHRGIVEACAAAGKHVLCEKPMATTAADARAMVEACGRAGVTYATAFDQRYHPAHRHLAGMVAAGDLGTVTQARIHYACWLPPDWAADNWRADPARAGGGAMIDLAPHGVDLLEFVLGERWESLHALQQRRVHPYPVDDGAVLMGRTESGALATLHVAYNCPDAFPRRSLEVIGTKARAALDDTMGQTPGGTFTLTRADGRVTAVAVEGGSPFAAQVAFYAANLGRPYPFAPADDLRRHELLEAALCATPR